MKNKKSPLENAFHYLSFRSRSEKEMRDYLKKKEILEIDETIEKLKELDFINDNKFIQEFVDSRSKNKPKGKKALMIELARKGIKVKELDVNEDELAKKALLKKKTFRDRNQLQRFLYSRGFSSSVIERAVKAWYNTQE
ncbi:RecX family transcriptional regulator [Candidatus Amesbacteria bacterium]|nr:RecX family transcriptional regulator [Candidatus Amesbacteria bacterium]